MISGLLLKEVYTMKIQMKTWIFLYAFYTVISVLSKNNSLLFIIVPMLALIMSMNMMGFDVQNKWDEFVLCTPAKRSTVVISQYLFIGLLTVVTTVVAVAAGLLMAPVVGGTVQEILAQGAGVFAAGLLLVDIAFPMQYKFGIEKARYLVMAVCMLVPLSAVFIARRLNLKLPEGMDAASLLPLIPVLLAFATVLSVWLCIRIYQKKEY